MPESPDLMVADVGNSRIKCARLVPPDRLPHPVLAFGASEEPSGPALALFQRGAQWAIASVNRPAADRLAGRIEASGGWVAARFDRASDVPVRSELDEPETAGADRALMVLAALERQGGRGPGIVASIGTALTVERIGPDGTWQGGAIGPGLPAIRAALGAMTAQLPDLSGAPTLPDEPGAMPVAWGASTVPAIRAGTAWGLVGIARELVARQSLGFESPPWVIWTGGDGRVVARAIIGDSADYVPDLVLRGLAIAGFGPAGGSP